jgi:ABC-type uncharacterized transport system involved in gliding motility auxiliary subunit
MQRTLKYGSNAGLLVAVFLAILVVLYLFALHHNRSWDFSQGGENRLDAKSLSLLKALKYDVDIKVFERKGEANYIYTKDLLELFKLANPHIRYDIIDPDMHPDKAKTFGVERYGQAILLGGGKKEFIDKVDEESLTNALYKLGRTKQKTINFIEGHGERGTGDGEMGGIMQLKEALTKDNHAVKPILLMREAIPSDADLLAIIGPEKSFFPEEISALAAYLDKGGRMLVALEPGRDAGLTELLSRYGIRLENDIIIDTMSRVLGGDYSMPVVIAYGKAKAVRDFTLVTFFPSARSLEIMQPLPQDVEVEWLGQTSDQSWSEFDVETWNKEGNASFDPKKDRKGPRSIGLYVKKEVRDKNSAQLIVFGDSDFLTNTYLNLSGNKDLALNCINMLLGEGALVTIEKKPSRFKPFILTPSQGALVFWIPVVGIPAVILLAAIAVFLSRRKA